jgi:hypothetical protein
MTERKRTMKGDFARDMTGDGRENYIKSVGRELGYEKPLKSKRRR